MVVGSRQPILVELYLTILSHTKLPRPALVPVLTPVTATVRESRNPHPKFVPVISAQAGKEGLGMEM